jgi:hypothetical protein
MLFSISVRLSFLATVIQVCFSLLSGPGLQGKDCRKSQIKVADYIERESDLQYKECSLVSECLLVPLCFWLFSCGFMKLYCSLLYIF